MDAGSVYTTARRTTDHAAAKKTSSCQSYVDQRCQSNKEPHEQSEAFFLVAGFSLTQRIATLLSVLYRSLPLNLPLPCAIPISVLTPFRLQSAEWSRRPAPSTQLPPSSRRASSRPSARHLCCQLACARQPSSAAIRPLQQLFEGQTWSMRYSGPSPQVKPQVWT